MNVPGRMPAGRIAGQAPSTKAGKERPASPSLNGRPNRCRGRATSTLACSLPFLHPAGHGVGDGTDPDRVAKRACRGLRLHPGPWCMHGGFSMRFRTGQRPLATARESPRLSWETARHARQDNPCGPVAVKAAAPCRFGQGESAGRLHALGPGLQPFAVALTTSFQSAFPGGVAADRRAADGKRLPPDAASGQPVSGTGFGMAAFQRPRKPRGAVAGAQGSSDEVLRSKGTRSSSGRRGGRRGTARFPCAGRPE